jgi:hypothetical protein
MLAITHPPVLPSAMLNGVGTPVKIISQLNTLPALPPVNASMAASRLSTHDSGPGWLATPFLYDSFIHNSTPVLSRRTQQPASQDRQRCRIGWRCSASMSRRPASDR